jgi:outer membrane protein assembly factor BamA
MKLAAALVAVAVLAVGGWTTARWRKQPAPPAPAPTAPPREVASIRLDGPSLPIVTLQGALATRLGSPVDEATLAADRVRISDILTERGHLGAEVAPATVLYGPSGAHVTFAVVPGPIYRIRSVRVEGAAAADLDDVTTALPGEEVSLQRARHGVDQIDRWLAEHGAPEAKVDYRLELDREGRLADIVYKVSRPRLARR